jgi:riboflavin-specific deaminase-like protein
VGTVLKDDPQLTVRLVKGRNPLRIVADSKLRTPLNSKMLKEQEVAPTVIAATEQGDIEKMFALSVMGVEVVTIEEDKEGMVQLKDMLKKLGERNISSILVEGGATIITSFIRRGLADKIVAIIAPKVMGKGIETVGDLGLREVNRALKLTFDSVYRKGEDIVIEASIKK